MKPTTTTVGSFSFYSTIILLLFCKLQQEYVGAQVRVCDENKFGYECRFQCRCQQNETCNEKTGNCPSRCAPGFWGSNCQLSNECYYNGRSDYYRGTKSVVRGTTVCNKWNTMNHNYCRTYSSGSKPWCYVGYSWSDCDINNCECPPGLYGVKCEIECHCKNASEVCDSNTGKCINCGPGWKGRHCRQECESGTFGPNCELSCHCIDNSLCPLTDGKCLRGGCIEGYTGESCQKECDIGSFGKECRQKCHCVDNSKCRKSDGKCLDGVCLAGYLGDDCQTSCPVGKFGEECKAVCQCLNPSLCNNTNGRCADRKCSFGYRGENCQERCLVGKFGEECKRVCHCQNPSLCNKTDGRCADKKCSFGYKGQNCQKFNLILLVALIIPILICIIIGVCCYLKKRKSKKTIDCEELKSVDNVSMSQIEQLNLAYDANEAENIYQNTELLAKDNILAYLERNKMEEEPFTNEFSRLPQGLIYPHEAGTLDENVKKNRYKTLLPYDHSRVVLLPDAASSSNYINASYVTEEKKYIATQGPMKGMANDFWRMIWQEKCSTIVMLTGIIENGKLKCSQYWPDLNQTETHGKYKVHCVQEKKFMIYTYRLLSICQSNNLALGELFIDHFQCTTWPDHGVPEDPIYFIEFRNKIRSMKSSKQPYVVHCSAGIGRTGTYIALDILLEKLWKNSSFDVFQCVNDLRQQRPLMVHRRRQYQFIYEVLAEDFLTGFSEIITESIPTEFRRMLNKESDAKSPLEEQYEKLLLPVNPPNKNLHQRKESIYKNISRNNDGDNNSDDVFYKTFLDGYTMTNEIILTNQPSENLTEDFWKFVYQKRCPTIIMFEELFNDVAAYWPDEKNCPTDYGNVNVELMNLTETETFFQRQFKVSSIESTLGDILVNHFQSKIWLNNLPSQKEMIEFIQTVSGFIMPQKQILVHCQDGCTKSGLFSLLYVMLQIIKRDPYVSILRLVRRMRKKNANIVKDFRTYEYCWLVANVFLGELSIYANF